MITEGDTVKIHTEGIHYNSGEAFFNTRNEGLQAMEFQLLHPTRRMVNGFEESLQLMGLGGIGNFYLPYHLGYGVRGNPAAGIRPYEDIIFNVEVLEVTPGELSEESHDGHNHDGHDHDHNHDHQH
jgi:FKBP-type peptidyl-prolyl cis-trans isomerase